jgi:uncharacterized membrane protein
MSDTIISDFRSVIEIVGASVDCVGVLVIVLGIVLSTYIYLFRKPPADVERYRLYRQNLGKGILLGLEILVAGDIIRTVGVAPTMTNVLILAVVVAIRTFLSWSLDVELEGRWPWQRSTT